MIVRSLNSRPFASCIFAGGPDGTGEEDHVPEVQEDQVHVAEDHVSERPSTSNREQVKRKRAGDVSDNESESDEERP